MNIFERAVRSKLRFRSNKGMLSVEDLFDMSLASLDQLAITVNKRLKESSEESFISQEPSPNTEDQLRLDLLKHVIQSKLVAQQAAKTRTENMARKAQLMNLLAEKKLESMKNMSEEDIKKELESLSV